MEILKILEESGKDLYLEDLDFFETELATGGPYEDEYRLLCQQKITEIRKWLAGGSQSDSVKTGHDGEMEAPVVSLEELAPMEYNPAAAAMTPEEMIFHDILSFRANDGYKKLFKGYVKRVAAIDAAFVDKNYAFFQPWELDAIISVKQMGEAFIEKYFGALDHEKIARYQQFSESFFMKHFAQLDAEIVLKNGKNEWHKKENRSKQLDVFLRLKGVKI